MGDDYNMNTSVILLLYEGNSETFFFTRLIKKSSNQINQCEFVSSTVIGHFRFVSARAWLVRSGESRIHHDTHSNRTRSTDPSIVLHSQKDLHQDD